MSNWHVELSWLGFICKYEAECRPLHSVCGNQSAQSWASWYSGLNTLGDEAVAIYKWQPLFPRGHGNSTISLLRKNVYIIY